MQRRSSMKQTGERTILRTVQLSMDHQRHLSVFEAVVLSRQPYGRSARWMLEYSAMQA